MREIRDNPDNIEARPARSGGGSRDESGRGGENVSVSIASVSTGSFDYLDEAEHVNPHDMEDDNPLDLYAKETQQVCCARSFGLMVLLIMSALISSTVFYTLRIAEDRAFDAAYWGDANLAANTFLYGIELDLRSMGDLSISLSSYERLQRQQYQQQLATQQQRERERRQRQLSKTSPSIFVHSKTDTPIAMTSSQSTETETMTNTNTATIKTVKATRTKTESDNVFSTRTGIDTSTGGANESNTNVTIGWPFVTTGEISQRGASLRTLTQALHIAMWPLVTQENRYRWESYSVDNLGWAETSNDNEGDDDFNISSYISNIRPGDELVVANDTARQYFPMWQR